MVTPMSDRDTLDIAGLERLVEHILGGGVHGLFILGTSGEGPSLSYKRRCELIERVCGQVANRVPVLVGVSDTAFVESANLADFAADAGAQAVVLSAPYYFPAGQGELRRYVERLAAELPLPAFLYNMPSHTKLSFQPETVGRLMEIPDIVGLKDSSADMIYFHRLLRLAKQREDWTLLVGPEQLLAEAVLFGGDGGVSGGANLCPRLYVDLYNAAAGGDVARATELHAHVMQLSETIYTVARHGAAVIRGLKCALGCLGICSDWMAEPFDRLPDEERRTLREHLENLQAVVDVPFAPDRV